MDGEWAGRVIASIKDATGRLRQCLNGTGWLSGETEKRESEKHKRGCDPDAWNGTVWFMTLLKYIPGGRKGKIKKKYGVEDQRKQLYTG